MFSKETTINKKLLPYCYTAEKAYLTNYGTAYICNKKCDRYKNCGFYNRPMVLI
jgi:hypothetical protein